MKEAKRGEHEMTRTKHNEANGFTIIELLVVIAIISLLVGLLTPGISMMNRHARTLKQKTIIKGYETGLEIFRKDFDYYPPSSRDLDALGTGQTVCGAQKLAEALMGRDMEGFDPKSKFFDTTESAGVYNGPASTNRRKEPYTVVKDDGICSLEEVYGAGNIGSIFSPAATTGDRAPVMTDIFGRRKVTLASGENIKIGAPVLYFRADTATKRFMGSEPVTQTNYTRWIYNYDDNVDIINLGKVEEPTVRHKFEASETTVYNGQTLNGIQYFYEKIRNPQYRTLDAGGNPLSDKPYNASTFILMSAGWDGIFGTKDDVTNFAY